MESAIYGNVLVEANSLLVQGDDEQGSMRKADSLGEGKPESNSKASQNKRTAVGVEVGMDGIGRVSAGILSNETGSGSWSE
jgi:hypothetical protein